MRPHAEGPRDHRERFYNNERVALSELIEPLRDYVREQVGASRAPFVLVAHDWCKLSYPGHAFRKDLADFSNKTDVGYELTTSLAIDATDGAPLAPIEMHLKTGPAFFSTREPAPAAAPALLAGLWSLLSMLDTLEHYDVSALQALLTKVKLSIPLLNSG